MQINTIKPASGAKHAKRRVGRGIGSGLGKTAGRGHKGQSSRAGGYHKVGFEGGQMPLQRRLPKIGFRSMSAPRVAEVRLNELALVEGGTVTLDALKKAGVVPANALKAKVVLSGAISVAVKVSGVGVTRGARTAIEAVGGSVEAA